MATLCKVTTTDDYQEFDAYQSENDPSHFFMTREQLVDLYSPYDVRFLDAHEGWNHNDYPIAVIYTEDEITLESSPLWVDDRFIEVYHPDIELMEAE